MRLTVALAGNPNAGKTSLFNALTGAHYKVGNYPGVTVEKRQARREYKGVSLLFVDLPGTYSLTAYSLDEVVARDFILTQKPDLVVDVLDSTTLERSLALCLQFQELGLPMVGALNMSDEAKKRGISIDVEALEASLGIPLVQTVGAEGKGIDALLDAIIAAPARKKSEKLPQYGSEIESHLGPLQAALEADRAFAARYPARWMAVKLLEHDQNAEARLGAHKDAAAILAEARLGAHKDAAAILAQAAASRDWIRAHFGKESEIVVSEQRYGYIRGALAEAVRKETVAGPRMTERIDNVLMNPLLGLPIFFLIMWAMFSLTFGLGAYPQAWLESLFAWLGNLAQSIIPEGFIQSLVVQGILAGVGGVFSFVPLIVLLFFFLSILEDVGYMSRAAFLTDKFLHAFGLHGQSFMPMILGFGCSVPAIMATRTLKSPKDRIATILAVPFMSCGAKLPVYVLLAGAFFPKNPGNAVMSVYLAGVVLSLVSTIFLRKTVLRGPTTPFVMELPPYRMPTLRGLVWHVGEKTWQYAKKAGTVILTASIAIWLLTNFPVAPDLASLQANAQTAGVAALSEASIAEIQMEYSFAGRIGKDIEPLIAPLGFSWKIGVALVSGFAAKELVVSTLGVLYGASPVEAGTAAPAAEAAQGSLREALQQNKDLNPLTAFVLMMVILIMPPCIASLATIRAEAGWKWFAFQVLYTFALAWLVGFAVKSLGHALGLA